MKRLLPRSLPELVAHAIGFERDAASRFHEYAEYLRELGHHGMAEIYYRDAAANSPDPRVRGFAADLAAGEHRHVRVALPR